jgi:hypothetical protein
MAHVADDTEDSLPYLPDSAPVLPDVAPVVPTVPPQRHPGPAARADPGAGTGPGSDHELTLADQMATRNVQAARPVVDYGLPAQPVAPSADVEPFVRPELESMGPSTTALLIGRGLMVIAALLIGIAARRASGSSSAERAEAFWPVAASAGVFVVVGFAGLVFWTVTLADNAQRLKARVASPRSMGWSWAFVVLWVVVSSVTYLRIEADAELDPLPGVAGLGFVLLLAIPYGKLQRVFRGLSRRPPVLWVSAFPLDAVAFGLLWWRLTSWPDPVTVGDLDHVRLTANIAFGAAGALTVNVIVFVWLSQRGSSSVYERLGRLEARQHGETQTGPEWFATGLPARRNAAPVEQRPLINVTPLTGFVAFFHVLWGVSMALLGVALARFAFEYSDRTPSFDGTLLVDDDDADRIAFVAGVVSLVYVLTLIVHAVWSVLVALNARRVTVHAPNPASFGILFAPAPVLVVTGLLIGGNVGYWIVLIGLAYAFFALLRSNQMLMTLSSHVGGELRGFSTWTALIGFAYLVGVVENLLFSQTAGQLGFFATASLMQGVLIGIGGVVGYRSMSALDATMRGSRQVQRQPDSDAPPGSA